MRSSPTHSVMNTLHCGCRSHKAFALFVFPRNSTHRVAMRAINHRGGCSVGLLTKTLVTHSVTQRGTCSCFTACDHHKDDPVRSFKPDSDPTPQGHLCSSCLPETGSRALEGPIGPSQSSFRLSYIAPRGTCMVYLIAMLLSRQPFGVS